MTNDRHFINVLNVIWVVQQVLFLERIRKRAWTLGAAFTPPERGNVGHRDCQMGASRMVFGVVVNQITSWPLNGVKWTGSAALFFGVYRSDSC